jgi:hypothetical protein
MTINSYNPNDDDFKKTEDESNNSCLTNFQIVAVFLVGAVAFFGLGFEESKIISAATITEDG